MSEYRFKIGDFAPTRAGLSQISDRRGRPTSHSYTQKTMINDFSYGIKIWTDCSSFLSQSTCFTDRRTNIQRGKNRASQIWLCLLQMCYSSESVS